MGPLHSPAALQNSNRASVVRCSRQRFERMFPVMLVRPDGSTVLIRYREPRCILLVRTTTDETLSCLSGVRTFVLSLLFFQMPVNLSTLSEEERRARQKRREVKKPQTEESNYEDDFQVDTYSHLWRKE